ncbi:hypothetical protein [Streptomyces sp. SBT349]|uniref:hypothetical protein n=1 Tax=Streptomyces sp. SBT349 TaxID=1580539 RepID=UPI00066D37E8|nr:hypothetical protein [Streptomyces sp. SBT349]
MHERHDATTQPPAARRQDADPGHAAPPAGTPVKGTPGPDTKEGDGAAAPGEGPRPLGVPTTATGHDGVDARLRRLADVDHLPVAAHLEAYEDVHRGLRDTLTALDRPAPGPAAPTGPAPGPVPGPASASAHGS